VQRAPGVSCALCFRGRLTQQLGRIAPRECGCMSFDGLFEIQIVAIRCVQTRTTPQPSSPATRLRRRLRRASVPVRRSFSEGWKAGDPVFRGVGDRVGKLRRTGSPAFAEYDGSLFGGNCGTRSPYGLVPRPPPARAPSSSAPGCRHVSAGPRRCRRDNRRARCRVAPPARHRDRAKSRRSAR
jgi:hypothetical protein